MEREEKIRFEVELHEVKLKRQAELDNINKQMSNQTPTEQDGGNMLGIRAKLPKLIISKFNGENIDQTSIAPISKFSYLRELLGEKVKHTIEALPFTPEGYNKAKSILLDKYGNVRKLQKSTLEKF